MTRVYPRPSDEEIARKLSPLQYEVTQRDATEPPFNNAYWDNHEDGIYVDIVSGEPLFSSRDKFDSGTGWPSFTRPIHQDRITEHVDTKLSRRRIEVRSRDGNSHLGHVFEDGPAPTGLRYCINSAALRFIPVDELEAEGYGEYLALFQNTAEPVRESTDNACLPRAATEGQSPGCQPSLEMAILAGGCFWGMEALLCRIPGVVDTEVGYTGGHTLAPTYEQVRTGRTGHAEAVRVIFDPARLSYEELLERWFFRMHDPTTKDRQGNDRGTQYRSAIFYTSPEQKRVAELVKARVDASGKWPAPLVTEITALGTFTPAEQYHQDYLQRNPTGYTCHFLRD